MPDQIIIAGVPPYDGRYDFNFEQGLNTKEWGWIKRHAGYLPVTLGDDAFSDPELVCVLAIIALHRAGRVEARDVPKVFDRFADAPFGTTVTVEPDPDVQAEEDGADPLESSNGNEPSSGTSSTTNSETSEPTQPLYGIPGSDTSAYARQTSVT